MEPFGTPQNYRIVDAHSTYFKLSEWENGSIINIIQVKFSCFLVALFHLLGCRGAVQPVLDR